MPEIEQFSTLLGDIYDASSLDPALWPEAFAKACRYVGGTVATLTSQDTLGKAARFYYSWGTDSRCDQHYCDGLFRFNPVSRPCCFSPSKSPTS